MINKNNSKQNGNNNNTTVSNPQELDRKAENTESQCNTIEEFIKEYIRDDNKILIVSESNRGRIHMKYDSNLIKNSDDKLLLQGEKKEYSYGILKDEILYIKVYSGNNNFIKRWYNTNHHSFDDKNKYTLDKNENDNINNNSRVGKWSFTTSLSQNRA